jgi:hypothetical protein
MTGLLYTLLIALITLSIWNLVTSRELVKKRNQNVGAVGLSDPRYFELKYKNQFLVAMFAVFVGLGSFYGYNTLEDAKKEARTEIINSTDSLKNKLSELEKLMNENKSNALQLGNDFSEVSKNLPKLDGAFKRLSSLEQKIVNINQKNILKQNFYIVSTIERPILEKPQRLFLKDLTTSHGDKLPNFKSPPVIIAITDSKFQVDVYNVSTESFIVAWGTNLVDEKEGIQFNPTEKVFTFSLLVIER